MASGKANNTPEVRASAEAPLIFISHDHRDADLARNFSELLKSASAGILQTFNSSDRSGTGGIEYGHRWYPTIMKYLEAASAVVCILTRRSLARPWILYEAGVASARINKPILGLALGVPSNEANVGPFGQFHNCGDTVDEVVKLVIQLVKHIKNANPDKVLVKGQVLAFKDKVAPLLKDLDSGQHREADRVRPDALLEIHNSLRDLPTLIKRQLGESSSAPGVTGPRFRLVSGELIRKLDEMGSKAIGFLACISPLRDEWPWLYELGFEAYGALKDQDTRRARRALSEFLTYFEQAVDFTPQDDKTYFLLRDLWKLSDAYTQELLSSLQD
jgi:hypothetical protein